MARLVHLIAGDGCEQDIIVKDGDLDGIITMPVSLDDTVHTWDSKRQDFVEANVPVRELTRSYLLTQEKIDGLPVYREIHVVTEHTGSAPERLLD